MDLSLTTITITTKTVLPHFKTNCCTLLTNNEQIKYNNNKVSVDPNP